jgi:hypothetical protein
VCGCGGGGSPFSSFLGSWTGSQAFYNTLGVLQDQGQLTINVNFAGIIEGSITKFSNNEVVAIQGSVQPDGSISLTWQFSGELMRTATGPSSIVGGVWKPSTGNERLNVQNANGGVGSLGFALQRQG